MDWLKVYHALLREYGPQGWWPLLAGKKSSPPKKEDCLYHPGQYPHLKPRQRFEVGVGAILTQNTTFASVTECLIRLHRLGGIDQGLDPDGLRRLSPRKIASAIVPARYANRKAEYLLTWAEFFSRLERRIPTRKEILALRGIGNETADSILLYGFDRCEFVIDAYTCRILTEVGQPPKSYALAKDIFETQLRPAFPDQAQRVRVYQEYHALLVVHAKRYYSRKPYGWSNGKRCLIKTLS